MSEKRKKICPFVIIFNTSCFSRENKNYTGCIIESNEIIVITIVVITIIIVITMMCIFKRVKF